MSDAENTTLAQPSGAQALAEETPQEQAATQQSAAEPAPAAAPAAASPQAGAEATAAGAERATAAATEQPERPEGGEEFGDSLIDSYPQYSQPSTGTIMKGHVLKVTNNEVIVDVNYKCEGIIPIEEFRDSQGNVKAEVGQEIEVLMESAEERDGYVVLSYAKARRIRAWGDIEAAYHQGTPIRGVVVEKTKGGLAVDIGMRAFLPGSQVDIKPVRNLDALVGQEVSCKIIKVNRKRGNIVVSRKALLEEENKRRREETLAKLQEGAVLPGTVKNLTEYGAFVDLGGIDGLVHITDLSWGRVSHPSQVVSVGQQVQVKVLKFDREKERVSLSIKQLVEDPWSRVAEKYQAGSRIRGKVLNVTDYGAFIELEPGVEGLVHVSEMSWSKRLRHPSKIVSKGDEVEAVILDVNAKDRRISLGLKQTEPNPWATLSERYHVGSVVEGKVRNLTDFGAFVEVEDGIDGLVHVSDISWTQRVKHPSDVLKKGETVKAVILNIDTENRRLSLGIKQLQPDAWESFCNSNRVGDMVRGKVVRKTSFGVFVELREGIEGLCHVSEIWPEPRDKRNLPLEIGEEHEFRILKLSAADRKIGLSMKPAQAVPRQEPERVTYSSPGDTTTIGELVAMKERQAKN